MPIEHQADVAVHGSGPQPVQPDQQAASFGRFLNHVFTELAKFARDGGPTAARIIADPQFEAMLERLFRAHKAGRAADVIALIDELLEHRENATPQYLPAPVSEAR
jgi:hypothetical protein